MRARARQPKRCARERAKRLTGANRISNAQPSDEDDVVTTDGEAREDEDEDEGNSEDSEVDPTSGNYFGRAAAAPPAPEGANPFASAFTPEDDVAAQIAEAKRQCEERRIAREKEEAIEREKERKAFEDQGRTYVARKKASDDEPLAANAGGVARRRILKAKRPGASPAGASAANGGAASGASPFAAFSLLAGGADAAKTSVFSRLSAPEPNEKAEPSAKPNVVASENKVGASAAAPAPATFGFFAPPPVLTKETASTQRTAKLVTKEDDEDEDDDKGAKHAPQTNVKKVPSALAIELGLI